MQIFTQIIGLMGSFGTIASYQINNRKKLLYTQVACAIFFSLHFALLGAYSGAAINFVNAGRNYFFAKKGKDKKLLLTYAIIATASTALTWQNIYSVFPLLATLWYAYLIYKDNVVYIRKGVIIVAALWFVHNFANQSYPAMLTDTFVAISGLTAVIRYDVMPKYK